MFNYKSPLSRILEKPEAKVESDAKAQVEAEALERQSLREMLPGTASENPSADYHEDIDDLVSSTPIPDTDIAHPELEDTDEGPASETTEKPDFLVLQSVFDDAEMADEDNIFTEDEVKVDAPEALLDVTSSVLTLVRKRQEAAAPIASEARLEAVETPIETPTTTTTDPEEHVSENDEEYAIQENAGHDLLEAAFVAEIPDALPASDEVKTVASEPMAEVSHPEASEHSAPEPQEIEVQATAEVISEGQAPLVNQTLTPEAATPSAKPRRRDRIKTTFLGLEHVDTHLSDLISADPVEKPAAMTTFPVGWLVITDGPGRGACLALIEGLLQIGRNDDQALQLDFGDNGISRTSHAVVAYDAEERKCFLGHGGKANLVRLNGSPVLSTVPMANGDIIRISETTMRFVSFCDQDFDWRDKS